MSATSLRVLALAVALLLPPQAGAQSANASRAAGGLRLALRVDHVDTLAREPMVVRHPNGTLFAAGYGGPIGDGGAAMTGDRPAWLTRLWASRDDGATWRRVEVGGGRDVMGNSDVDLAVAPDGTLYFASMTYDASVLEGRRIAIGVSTDAGTTWKWTVVSRARFDDRPWVKVASDGRAHVIWNDGRGVSHVVSRDRGATWTTPVRIHDAGGSSHLAVGPKGELAVRIVPLSASGNKLDPTVDLVAVSTDGGASWRKHAPPAPQPWKALGDTTVIGRWVEPIAWDDVGRLHALWTDTTGVWLGRSSDRGATWQRWRIAESRTWCYYPYLIARGDAELAASWMCGTGDALRGTAARIVLRSADQSPLVARSEPFAFDSWFPRGPQKTLVRDPAGEYLGLTFLPGGAIGVVAPLQSPTRNGFTWLRFTP